MRNTDVLVKENNNIENMIYQIRGLQVMLSSDVTKLCRVETRRINEVIKDYLILFAFN